MSLDRTQRPPAAVERNIRNVVPSQKACMGAVEDEREHGEFVEQTEHAGSAMPRKGHPGASGANRRRVSAPRFRLWQGTGVRWLLLLLVPVIDLYRLAQAAPIWGGLEVPAGWRAS